MPKKIGFIGLGQMGKWMALNFLKADYRISVYDINTQAVDILVQNGAIRQPVTGSYGHPV